MFWQIHFQRFYIVKFPLFRHMEKFAIYTVCTESYKYGLFALLKSLRKFGYAGTVVVATNKVFAEIGHLENVRQVVMDTKSVFGTLKARLILDHPAETFLYLDSDIIQTNGIFIDIVLAELSASGRLFACIEGIVARNSVRRMMWNQKAGIRSFPLTDLYFNGGMLAGVFETHKPILEAWDQHIRNFIEPGKFFRATPEFPLVDQDILNMILQNIPEHKLFTISMPDWIGTATSNSPFHEYSFFQPPLFVHATGLHKTWALRTLPKRYPNLYDREFYKYHRDESLRIVSDLKFTWVQSKWLEGRRLIHYGTKIKGMLR